MVTCVLQMFVKFRALTQFPVRLANGVITMCALRFATQTIIAYPEKFAMNAVHAKPVASTKLIAHQRKYVNLENVNAAAVSSALHLVARILMSVRTKFATRVQFAIIRQDHTDVFVQSKRLVIHTQRPDAYRQINVRAMKTVLRTWLASKENVPSHAPLLNAVEMQIVWQANTRLSVNVHRIIWEIQQTKLTAASVLNASVAKIVAQINIVIHKSINVKVSRIYNLKTTKKNLLIICVSLQTHAIILIVAVEHVLLNVMKQRALVHRDTF